MVTAGIDVGLRNIKIVILKDEQVVARGSGVSGGEGRAPAVKRIWEEALDSAGVVAADVEKVVATGQGKYDVDFADDIVTEPVADARAARFLRSDVTSVVDMGADQIRVVTLGREYEIEEVSFHQKCSAGLGIFIEYMARRLGMTLEELCSLSSDIAGDAVVNDGCPVFAELGALELLNQGVPVREVAFAVLKAVAVRMNSILNDKIKPAADSTLLIGGVAKNIAVVRELEARSGIDFIIPEYAEYCGAFGAALIAAAC